MDIYGGVLTVNRLMMLEFSAVLYLKSIILLHSISNSLVAISDNCASGLLIPYLLGRRRRHVWQEFTLIGMDGRAETSILEDTETDAKAKYLQV
jgi:hypothetical protein